MTIFFVNILKRNIFKSTLDIQQRLSDDSPIEVICKRLDSKILFIFCAISVREARLELLSMENSG